MQPLIEAAIGYLGSSPHPWLAFVERLRQEFQWWVRKDLDTIDIEAVLRVIDSRVSSLLFDPAVVSAIAALSTDSEVCALMSSRLYRRLHRRVIELEDREATEYNEWHAGLMNIVSNFTIIQRGELHLEKTVIEGIVERSLGPRTTNFVSPLQLPTFSLELVDLALYEALVQHPELMRSLGWRAFERLLGDLLETFGYEIELQRGTKDGGIDLFAIRKSDPMGEHRYLLQAKRWTSPVGVEPVRELAFLHSHHRVSKSCLATTAAFTRGAWQLAHQYRWQIELRDLQGIHDWLEKAVEQKRNAIKPSESHGR